MAKSYFLITYHPSFMSLENPKIERKESYCIQGFCSHELRLGAKSGQEESNHNQHNMKEAVTQDDDIKEANAMEVNAALLC